MKKKLLILLALLVVVALAFFFVAAGVAERFINKTRQSPPYRASERARELHRTLAAADMHADSLLWDRDLLEPAGRGHAGRDPVKELPDRLVQQGVWAASPVTLGFCQDSPTIWPSASRSIRAAAGWADRPGMVRMSPQIG